MYVQINIKLTLEDITSSRDEGLTKDGSDTGALVVEAEGFGG